MPDDAERKEQEKATPLINNERCPQFQFLYCLPMKPLSKRMFVDLGKPARAALLAFAASSSKASATITVSGGAYDGPPSSGGTQGSNSGLVNSPAIGGYSWPTGSGIYSVSAGSDNSQGNLDVEAKLGGSYSGADQYDPLWTAATAGFSDTWIVEPTQANSGLMGTQGTLSFLLEGFYNASGEVSYAYPGESSFGFDLDGVVEVRAQGNAFCSGVFAIKVGSVGFTFGQPFPVNESVVVQAWGGGYPYGYQALGGFGVDLHLANIAGVVGVSGNTVSTGAYSVFEVNSSNQGLGAPIALETSDCAVNVADGQVYHVQAGTGAGILLDTITGFEVQSGGQAIVDPATSTATRQLLQVTAPGLSLAGTTNGWAGLLDLTNNDMDVVGGNLATVTSQIAQGYNNGNWNRTGGIISSTAAADTTHLTAVGVIQNNQSGTAIYTAGNQFDGIAPGVGDILVKYTYYGDANLDGKVDGSDYTLIDNGYLNQLTGWFNGDFNYDGVVDGSDYALIDNAFNNQGAALSAQVANTTAEIAPVPVAAVPEPANLSLLGIGSLALLRRRRAIQGVGSRFGS